MALGVVFACFVNDADAAPTMAASADGAAAPPARGRVTGRPASLEPVVTADGAALSLALTRAMLSRFPLIDGHNDLPWEIREKYGSDPVKAGLAGRVPDTQTDIPRLVEGGVGGQFWSVYVPASTGRRHRRDGGLRAGRPGAPDDRGLPGPVPARGAPPTT